MLIPTGGEVTPYPVVAAASTASPTATDVPSHENSRADLSEKASYLVPGGSLSEGGRGVNITGDGSVSSPGSVTVGKLSYCSHPELHGTLCTSCGRQITALSDPPGAVDGFPSGVNGVPGVGGGQGGSGDGMEGRTKSMSKVTMKGGGTLTVSSTGETLRSFSIRYVVWLFCEG